MAALHDRFAPWLDLVRWLVEEPTPEFPDALLVGILSETFGCRAASTWAELGGEYGFLMRDPPTAWPGPDAVDFWAGERLRDHPLFDWLMATGSPVAISLGRIPVCFGSARTRGLIREQLGAVELDQQLAIPVDASPTGGRALVLARGGRDFADDDVDLARRIQPLLMLLARHVSAIQTIGPVGPAEPLTGRELAVLALLSKGMTSAAIASRLGVSARTVQKHLERLYRKLGVCDRLMAVDAARRLGLLGTTDPARSRPATLWCAEVTDVDVVVVRAPFSSERFGSADGHRAGAATITRLAGRHDRQGARTRVW